MIDSGEVRFAKITILNALHMTMKVWNMIPKKFSFNCIARVDKCASQETEEA